MSTYMGKARSINHILQDAFKLYKSNFTKIWLLGFLIALVNAFSALYPPLSHVETITANEAVHLINFSWLGGIIFFFTYLISIYLYSLIIYYLHARIAEGQDQTLLIACHKAFTKLPKTFLATIIVHLLILFCVALTVVGYFLVGVITVLALLLAVFIFIALIMYLPLILIDNEGIIDSMKKSQRLVIGNWWQTFTPFLLPALIFLLWQLIIVAIFGEKNSFAGIIGTIISSTFISPFIFALILRQFYHLKAVKRIPKLPLLR